MKIIIEKFKSEFKILKSEIPLPEYILWWIIRVFMIYLAILSTTQDKGGHYSLQMISNCIMLYILPELHILPRKFFLARLHYRCQTVAALMVFLTCGIGMHFNFYGNFYWYDMVLHLLGGMLLVLIGHYVVVALKPSSEPEPGPYYSSVAGFGISLFGAIFWECYEFIFDWISAGNTQNYTGSPETFIVNYFPVATTEQYPLFDTMSDLFAGLFGAIIGAVILRIIAERKLKKITQSAI